VPSQSNSGGCDQSAALLKSTSPLENSAEPPQNNFRFTDDLRELDTMSPAPEPRSVGLRRACRIRGRDLRLLRLPGRSNPQAEHEDQSGTCRTEQGRPWACTSQVLAREPPVRTVANATEIGRSSSSSRNKNWPDGFTSKKCGTPARSMRRSIEPDVRPRLCMNRSIR
jgi:hypothetical protein